MVEEQATGRRPRRRRRRRRGGRAGAAPEVSTGRADARPARAARALSEWQWFTFPVFFAFVIGAFLILLIAPEPRTNAYTVLFFLFLFATAYGLIHMLVRWWLIRRRR